MWYATCQMPNGEWTKPAVYLQWKDAMDDMRELAQKRHFIVTPSKGETEKRMAAGKPPSAPSAINK